MIWIALLKLHKITKEPPYIKLKNNKSKISLLPVRYTNGNILRATNSNNKGAIPCKFEKQQSQLQRNVTFHKQAISLKVLLLQLRILVV